MPVLRRAHPKATWALTSSSSSVNRDGFTCTVYEPSTRTDTGLYANLDPRLRGMVGNPRTDILYDGSEGELYDHANDPHQWRNLWSDPQYAKLKADLIDDLYGHMPAARQPAPGGRSADVGGSGRGARAEARASQGSLGVYVLVL